MMMMLVMLMMRRRTRRTTVTKKKKKMLEKTSFVGILDEATSMMFRIMSMMRLL